jgi:hypothetical protein
VFQHQLLMVIFRQCVSLILQAPANSDGGKSGKGEHESQNRRPEESVAPVLFSLKL